MPRAADVYVTIKGSLTGRETDKAIQMLVQEVVGSTLEEEKLEWFPFSQVQKVFRNKLVNKPDELFVKEWILQQKGMI